MASAIGLRGYMITAHKKGDTKLLSFEGEGLSIAPPEFFAKFVEENVAATQDDEKERSWFFEELEGDGEGNSRGHTHYGTFGFESNFIDIKTKKKNYRRKVNDIEEIPLFYEFWWPEEQPYLLASFQSFQGRSCIGLVMEKAQEWFATLNPGYVLKYRKLLPSEGSVLYAKAPVKRLRLIKRNASHDVTDSYLGKDAPDKVNFEVRLSAGRNGVLGPFGQITKTLKKSDAGLVLHDGIEFSEVYADVKIGGKYRPVGVFGGDTNAGVIDITDSVVKGADGHPTFESVCKQSDKILLDFFEVLSNKK